MKQRVLRGGLETGRTSHLPAGAFAALAQINTRSRGNDPKEADEKHLPLAAQRRIAKEVQHNVMGRPMICRNCGDAYNLFEGSPDLDKYGRRECLQHCATCRR